MKEIVVLLDNGHGRETPGKRSPIWSDGRQLFEWQNNRRIVEGIARGLASLGIRYEILVPETLDISLSERVSRANIFARELGPANTLLLSIHSNAAASPNVGTGWEVHTSPGATRADEYAGIFLRKAKEILSPDFRIRGQYESKFAILTKSLSPAVLTENLFHDNERDCRFLLSEEGNYRIVRLHVEAIKVIVGYES